MRFRVGIVGDFRMLMEEKNPITISIFTYFPSKSEQNIPEQDAEYLIKRPFSPSST